MVEAKDERSEAQKPVIEVITTVSERGNKRIVDYRPVCYGSESEISSSDEDDCDVNTKKVMRTEIFVHSKHLINALRVVIGSYPGVDFLSESISFEAPYHALFHHRDGLSRYRIAQPPCHDDQYAASTARHIDVLLGYLDKTYGERVREEKARHRRGTPVATCDWLWLLFKPGEVIYKELHNVWMPFIIDQVIHTYGRDGKERRYEIDCWGVHFSDGKMRRYTKSFDIIAFSGEQSIPSLEVIPAAFFPEDLGKQAGLSMGDKQIAMGKLYWELAKRPAYKEHDGQNTGRVIVDAEGYDRFSCAQEGNDRPGPFANFEDLDPLTDTPPRNDMYFLVCSPNIPAFILSDRRWGQVSIDHLSDVRCDTEAFEYLVLDEGVKSTVKALTGKFASLDGKVSPWPNDFVRNKGEGRIFLLHGSPGVGKTCTAECVAELTRRPLLSLTSGDISTSMSSWNVEQNLHYFLTLGERYGALVLLDEADVYLEERRARDLRRNGLVSIFLRALEYYRGVLFLTTNRVESFDPAFTSRIHVALHYKRLGDTDRARIWANSFDRLERDSAGKVYITPSAREMVFDQRNNGEVNLLRWNGREIRNALQTAVALAETEALDDGIEKVSIAARHIRQVVKMSRGFKDYLMKRRGCDSDDEEEREEEEEEDAEVASEFAYL
ncbi:hypothetical protein UCDDA912_g00845 [Diaporthe ampelina]|uniref:AAA+ ATPase domain-containing protein n=1 Tax=Diaporthe ampelina TaxID=1214573 RepID=A0A0G2FZ31_9PEZI|nr:hypothetical protein UCDDA912_g00845 [Diaporthe ampelina]